MLPGTAGSRGHRLWVDANIMLWLSILMAIRPERWIPLRCSRGCRSGPEAGGYSERIGIPNLRACDQKRGTARIRVAVLAARPANGDLDNTTPALHVYEGGKISQAYAMRDAAHYCPFAGVALEAQGWTDAPHHPTFPAIDLPAGNRLTQTTIYSFSDLSGPRP